jgi:SAM-dependent methyltransferase
MLKRILTNMYREALILNDINVIKAAKDYGPFPRMLDVGCWDGEKSLAVFKAAETSEPLGIELISKAATMAEQRGIATVSIAADREPWPYPDGSIDCVVSNQVVEHLTDMDYYFSEAARVLKSGGVLISSTNNLSSWHNIWSLVFGWAPFDFTNSSNRVGGIGNPLALHKGEPLDRGASWTHKCIYTARWLFEWQALYGLRKVTLYTSGYYPLPGHLGRFFQQHAAFIVTVTRKTRS